MKKIIISVVTISFFFISLLACEKTVDSENNLNPTTLKNGTVISKNLRESYVKNKEVIDYLLSNGFTIDEDTKNDKYSRKKIISLGEAKKLVAQIRESKIELMNIDLSKKQNIKGRGMFLDCNQEGTYYINGASAGMFSSFSISFDRGSDGSISNISSHVTGFPMFWGWTQTHTVAFGNNSFCIDGTVNWGIDVEGLPLAIHQDYSQSVTIDPRSCQARVEMRQGHC